MKSRDWFLAAACACVSSSAVWAEAGVPTLAQVELRQSVSAVQSDVTLGQVANISSHSLPTLQHLMALPLGRLPRDGDPVPLERDALLRWIRVRLGMDADQIAWHGPENSQIRLATIEVTGEQIASAAQSELLAVLAKSGLRAQVDVSESPRDLRVPGGKLELRPRAAMGWRSAARDGVLDPMTAGSAMLAKRQSVWVDLWVDGRFVRTVPVGFEVSVFAPAYVAVHNLTMGQAIAPSQREAGQFVVRDVEWSGRGSPPIQAKVRDDSGPVADLEAGIAGQQRTMALRLRHPLAAGSALTRADVEEAPMVARGDYATLHAFQGMIALESRVEVLQDGSLGQPVHVKLAGAAGTVVARVTAPGQVEVRQ